MTWMNNDGLFQKFGPEEATVSKGGEFKTFGQVRSIEFDIAYTDALSATASILGSVSDTNAGGVGSYGIEVPAGVRIESVEVLTETAFTSSGTIGSASMVIGLIRKDRSTTYDVDGFTTSSFVGGAFDAAGERTYIVPGVTGVGAFIGTTLANPGYIVVANAGHASHPFTAGKMKVRINYYNDQTVG